MKAGSEIVLYLATLLVGQVVLAPASWGLGNLLVAVVVIAAAIALVYVALRQFGITIPQWVVQCFWIVVVAFVVVFCIRLLLGM